MSNPPTPLHDKLFFFTGSSLQHCLKEMGVEKGSFYPFEISKMSESPFRNVILAYKISTSSKQQSPV